MIGWLGMGDWVIGWGRLCGWVLAGSLLMFLGVELGVVAWLSCDCLSHVIF